MLNRSKFWAGALLAATFVAGGVVGGVTSAAWGDGPDPATRPPARTSYADRLHEALDLTPAQRVEIDAILERRREAMRELWSAIAPRMDTLRTTIRQEILAVLEDEQQTAFREMIARNDSTRYRRGGGRHGR